MSQEYDGVLIEVNECLAEVLSEVNERMKRA